MCVITPLTGGPQWTMRWVTLLGRAQKGVLKGQMALGDAHPYLALFDFLTSL